MDRRSKTPEFLEHRLKDGPEDMIWATKHHVFYDNSKMIADAIGQGTAIAVMDGSYKAKLGTVAYLIKGEYLRN